ncbi:MAG: histidinol-phosphate transaminase [Lachnotalea sp.]
MKNIHGGDIYINKNMIDFSANINPLGLPRGVKIAIADSIDKAVHYPDTSCDALREKLAQKYEVNKDYLICGNGAADLIFAVTIALKPRKSLVLSPTFAEYEQALRAIGSEIIYYDLEESNNFKVDELIIDAFTSDVDMVFLCNPNNPTGEVIKKSLLMKMINKCKDNNIVIVIDECFNSFLDQNEAYSVMKETADFDNLIVINAFTKLYAMPGVRLGFGAVNNKLIHEFIEKSMQPWNVSVLAQEAGIAALEETEYVIKTKELITKERNYLMNELKQLGYNLYGSKANYIFFKGPKNLYEMCLENKMLIRDCSNYRGLEEGYYRIAVRTHEENVKLIDVLKNSIID